MHYEPLWRATGGRELEGFVGDYRFMSVGTKICLIKNGKKVYALLEANLESSLCFVCV